MRALAVSVVVLAVAGLGHLPAHAVSGGAVALTSIGAVSLEHQPSPDHPGRPQHVCSGVAIAPRWVMTAAHCLRGLPLGTARVGSLLRRNATQVSIAETYPAPSGDLGLIKLAADAPGPYAPWSPTHLWVGQALVTYGFGTAMAGVGGSASPSLKQVRSSVARFAPDAQFGGELILHRFRDGETRHGDSGGPVLLDGVVVGTHAGLFSGFGGATALYSSATWLVKTSGVQPVGGMNRGAMRRAAPSPTAQPWPESRAGVRLAAADSTSSPGVGVGSPLQESWWMRLWRWWQGLVG